MMILPKMSLFSVLYIFCFCELFALIALMTLRELSKHKPARIIGFQTDNPQTETRLREIGFAEGDMVEALHFGLFGRNPMSVRLNGSLIAMRKQEAQAVLVEIING